MTEGERAQVVEWFAERMLEKLCEPRNVAKGGWRNDHFDQLLDRLDDEVYELIGEVRALNAGSPNEDHVIAECCDVAAFAMFVADRARQLKG